MLRVSFRRVLSEDDFENVIVLSTEILRRGNSASHTDGLRGRPDSLVHAGNLRLIRMAVLSLFHSARQGIDSDFWRLWTGPADRDNRVYKASPVSTEALDQWLRTIRLLWPECPATISSDGLYLVINHATAVLSREQSPPI